MKTIPSHLEIYQEISNKHESLKTLIEIKYESLFDIRMRPALKVLNSVYKNI